MSQPRVALTESVPLNAETFAACADRASQDSGHPIDFVDAFFLGQVQPVARFALANGLGIIIAPDATAPVFAYQSWFGVGSKDEDPNMTGVAHLFEHLMFKGTTTFANGVFDSEMESRGAQTNAATWVDWTYYTQALAARDDNLQRVIHFESDRMHNLVIDTKSFTSELEVVKNERRMAVDDSVGGILGETLMALAFTKHPYRWPTIGSMQHLEAATIDELQTFYRHHYVPNKANVVIVGDVDVTSTLSMLATSYGPIKRQTRPKSMFAKEPEQTSRRQLHVCRPVLAPQVVMGFVAAQEGTADYYGLQMLDEILTAGDTARLYDRLVTRERIASDVSGFLTPFCDPGLFELHVSANPGVDPQRIIKAIDEEMAAVSTNILPDEITKATNALTLASLQSLRDVEGKAEALGHAQTTLGDASRALDGLKHYPHISKETLYALAKKTFAPHRASIVVASAEKAP